MQGFPEIDEFTGAVSEPPFDLSSIHGFPIDEWTERRTVYTDLESWYSGDKLLATQVQGGSTVEKYPVKFNPVIGACAKHAYALFGEVKSDNKPLAIPIFKPETKDGKKIALEGQKFLSRVWAESNGRSLMLSNGLKSQIYGGCVFKASFVPEQTWRKTKIRIEAVHPANFIGIPMAGDEYRLEQAWLVKAISAQEALRLYGMRFGDAGNTLYYVEYWTPEEYEITINGKVIKSKVKAEGKNVEYAGKNAFGMVPIVYIPHIRSTSFYGDSLISLNVQGIVEEWNKRIADFGDAVSDDSHEYSVGSGFSGHPEVYEVAPGKRVIQLPSSPSITGKEPPATLEPLSSSPKASISMKDLNELLELQFRREAFIPAVADGEDEGSQRSALTLAMRMWPLLSHTSMERIYWGDGLALLQKIIVKIALVKRSAEIPSELEDMPIEHRWAPVLPRDREAFINELVSRAGVHLGSLEHLLSLLDDIDDPPEEIVNILKQLKEFSEAQAVQQNNFVGDNSKPNSKPNSKEKGVKNDASKPRNPA